MEAIWKGIVIAKSDETDEIEGHCYFPIDSISKEYFLESLTKSSCPWKGQASYFHLMVEGDFNEDAAWYYPFPVDGAEILKDKIAFWKGVEIKESSKKVNWELLKVLNTFF